MDFKQYEAKKCLSGRNYCLHIAAKCKYYIDCITIGMETEETEDNVDLTDVFAEEEVPSLSATVDDAVDALDEEPILDIAAQPLAYEDAATQSRPGEIAVEEDEEDIPLMDVEELDIEEITYKPTKSLVDEDVSLADLLGM
jgi:hypothetical protein